MKNGADEEDDDEEADAEATDEEADDAHACLQGHGGGSATVPLKARSGVPLVSRRRRLSS